MTTARRAPAVSWTNQVSVVITTYNRLKFLKQALRCVRKQDAAPGDIVLCDGGSRDGTKKWVQENCPRIKAVWAKNNPGPAALMNLGLRAASGDFIAFLEADDLWRAPYLLRMSQSLARSNALLVHCDFSELDASGAAWPFSRLKKMPPRAYPEILGILGSAVPVARALGGCTRLSFTLFRRRIFSELGGFDESFRRLYHDNDLLFRVAERCGPEAFSWVDEDLGFWRRHAGQLTALPLLSRLPDLARLLRKHPADLQAKVTDELRWKLGANSA